MKYYNSVSISKTAEFVDYEGYDRDKAVEIAQREYEHLTAEEKRKTSIEVREFIINKPWNEYTEKEQDELFCLGYNLIPWKIEDAIFRSFWDDGIAVDSECKVNLYTHEIYNIGENNYEGDDGELDILRYEHVIINGEEYRAVDFEDYNYCCEDCPDETIYYYNE